MNFSEKAIRNDHAGHCSEAVRQGSALRLDRRGFERFSEAGRSFTAACSCLRQSRPFFVLILILKNRNILHMQTVPVPFAFHGFTYRTAEKPQKDGTEHRSTLDGSPGIRAETAKGNG